MIIPNCTNVFMQKNCKITSILKETFTYFNQFCNFSANMDTYIMLEFYIHTYANRILS